MAVFVPIRRLQVHLLCSLCVYMCAGVLVVGVVMLLFVVLLLLLLCVLRCPLAANVVTQFQSLVGTFP